MTELENKKIIIATHVYATGPAQDWRDFFIGEPVAELLFISHPLFFDSRLKSSGYEYYKKGNQIKENYYRIKKIPALLSYIKDVWLNIYWVMISGQKWDLYIGNDNLNALAGVILKWLGWVNKTVYYVIDYNPRRFKNTLLNQIYHWIDQAAVRYSDQTWNLSPRMIEGRERYFGFQDNKQKVVPIGIWFERFQRLDFSAINKHTLVFMGHILKKQGVQYVLAAVPQIIKIIPDFKFLVIGGGEYLPELKAQVEQLKIALAVEFTGYIESHEKVEKMLSAAGLAVAMYDKYDEQGNLSFTYFADPGKIKAYLAGGLPILLTDVSYNAKEIADWHCGQTIESDPESIALAVIKIMQDEKTLAEYRRNAIAYASRFDWNLIIKNTLKEIL
ncbi:MAG: glycosyltransferase [Patescibacteria group bacterium]|jgi:glycosyltransferase involved in cell wall biosynthesis